MAFTTDDLNTMERAIAMSELSVTINGISTTYRSMSELVKAYNWMYRLVHRSSTGASNPYSVAKFS